MFYHCIQLDHEIYIKYKKRHLTWSNLYLVIISALQLKVNKQKKHLSLITKNFWFFFQNSSVPFHLVTFDNSISCVLLIDKPNESFENSKTFERNTLSTKKSFLKEKKILHQQRQSANFTNFFRMRMPKINNSNLSNEKQKELKMGNFKRKYQKYLCQLVLI